MVRSGSPACVRSVEQRDLRGTYAGMRSNPLSEKIVCVLPRTGVVISFRELDPHRRFHHIAAFESGYYSRWRAICGWLVRNYVHTNATRDGNHSRDIRRYLFNGIDLEIYGE